MGDVFETAGTAAALPPEIAFLARHGICQATLGRAAALAERCGVTADVALIREGLLGADAFYRALAREAGLPFRETLRVHAFARFPEAVLTGLVPLGPGEADGFAFAPQGGQVVQLFATGVAPPRLAITTPSVILSHVMTARAGTIAAAAADGLPRASPHLSFRGGVTVGQLWGMLAASFAVGAGSIAWPAPVWQSASIVAGLVFLAGTIPRLASILERVPTGPERAPARMRERDLPVYTVVVPLYREGRVVPRLLRALAALDYPRAKLDIKLAVESDDRETAAALAAADVPAHVEIVVVPPGEPRTKPRALNVALALALGEYVVVYDAEDVPDPGQLRLAASIFSRSAPDVACLQARLAIDNTRDGILTRFFTIEYAALFDVLNPALARFDLPVMLGGTSNHLRADVLRGLGGWDAWNVTEDADLGLRLAAAGYRVADLPSTTLEEAPRRLGAWMHQRTRWMKGFVQVAIVHSRRPLAGLRGFGPMRFLAAGALSLGGVVSALVFPVLCTLAGVQVATGRWLEAASAGDVAGAAVGSIVFASGLLALTLPPAAALARRRLWWLMPLVPLMPLYFVLVSLAAWRGCLELLLNPQRWNKTEHGLARTSRTGRIEVDPS